MTSYKVFFALFFWILTCTTNSTSDVLNLPWDKKTIWMYEVRGYKSYILNVGEKLILKNEINDASLQISILYDSLYDKYVNFSDTIYDTIGVFVEETNHFGEDSIVFQFNIDFVRFWGDKILRVRDGYKVSMGDGRFHYLIKFPIKLNSHWENKYTFVSDSCAITAIDTTIKVRKREFRKCIEITIFRSMEGMKSTIKMYFNKKQGLVYYKEENNQDELILIEMKTK